MLERISLTIDRGLLDKIDGMVDGEEIKNRSRAVSLLLRKSLRGRMVEKAVLLAGKKNFLLEKILVWLKKNGIAEVVIAAGRNSEMAAKVKDGKAFGMQIEFSYDDNGGTAFALEKIKSKLREPFLLCYSDVFCPDLLLKDLLSFHDLHKSACTLLLASSSKPSNFGVATMLGEKIIGFDEKPANAEGFLVNAGVAVCDPAILPFLSNGPSFERNALPALAKQGQLNGFVYYGKWIH